jgi:GTP-binding protein
VVQVLKEMSDRLTSFFTHESPKRVFILIDARRGIGAADEKHMELIESVGIPHQLVITKVDKIPAHQIKKVEREILDKIKKKPLVFPYVLKTSASSGIGIAEMQVEVAMACGLAEERRKELYSDD